MKKIAPVVGLILTTLLFIGCSVDEGNTDDVLLAQVQGKWKLTELNSDTEPFVTPVVNGYVIELKSDGTFTSNEENGYSGGTYTVIKSPGKNLKLVYQKQWSSKLVYKYINNVSSENLYLQGSNTEPYSDDSAFFGGTTLTRIP